jgi:hypothetical protein
MTENKDMYEDFEELFDPKQVDVTVNHYNLSMLIERIINGEIDLYPDFRANGKVWDDRQMSQLIESALMNFPLPAFYIDVADDYNWRVLDGFQRLFAFKSFVIDKKFKLSKLEFFIELEGLSYDELSPIIKRKLKNTEVILFKIRKGIPKKVLTSLFLRINTNRNKLNPQEIRHLLNQGKATKLLNDIASTDWFCQYVNMSRERMLDKELILRFIAFYRRGYEFYRQPLREFLDEEMTYLNEYASEDELTGFKQALKRGLELSDSLLGKLKFHNLSIEQKNSSSVNKTLFEVTTVNFAKLRLEESTRLIERKNHFLEKYKSLIEESRFKKASTSHKPNNVRYRHEEFKKNIAEHSRHDY